MQIEISITMTEEERKIINDKMNLSEVLFQSVLSVAEIEKNTLILSNCAGGNCVIDGLMFRIDG